MLTRSVDETIKARAARDPEFRAALTQAAAECEADGDAETAQGLRDYLPK